MEPKGNDAFLASISRLIEDGNPRQAVQLLADCLQTNQLTLEFAELFLAGVRESGAFLDVLGFFEEQFKKNATDPLYAFTFGRLIGEAGLADTVLDRVSTPITSPSQYPALFLRSGIYCGTDQAEESLAAKHLGEILCEVLDIETPWQTNDSQVPLAKFERDINSLLTTFVEDTSRQPYGCPERQHFSVFLARLGDKLASDLLLQLENRLSKSGLEPEPVPESAPDHEKIMRLPATWEEDVEISPQPEMLVDLALPHLVKNALGLVDSAPNNPVVLQTAFRFLKSLGADAFAERVRLFAKLINFYAEEPDSINVVTDLLNHHAIDHPAHGLPIDADRVCFVLSTYSNTRMHKLATGLRAAGKKLTIVHHRSRPIPENLRELADQVFPVRTYFDLWTLFERRPLVFHVFVGAGQGCVEMFATLVMAPRTSVLDYYDPADSRIGPLELVGENHDLYPMFDLYARASRVAHNHFPGICARTLYPRALRSILPEMKGRQKRKLFPELGYGHQPKSSKLSEADGKLHVVYGGTFGFETTPGIRWRYIFELCQNADRLDIHVHLHLFPAGDPKFTQYRKIAEQSSHVHFHDPLPFDQWLSVLETYDVGLDYVYPADISLLAGAPTKIDNSGHWTNRFGDYLDSGLYILTDWRSPFISRVAREYGIGEPARADEVFTSAFWDRIRHKVFEQKIDFSRAKRELNMLEQGPRLAAFYEAFN